MSSATVLGHRSGPQFWATVLASVCPAAQTIIHVGAAKSVDSCKAVQTSSKRFKVQSYLQEGPSTPPGDGVVAVAL